MFSKIIKTLIPKGKKLGFYISEFGLVLGYLISLLGYLAFINRKYIKIDWLPLFLITIFAGLILWAFSAKDTKISKCSENKVWFFSCAILLCVTFGPAIMASIMMAKNHYPEVFFNIDSPYHFSQCLALTQNNDIPPASLYNLGVRFNYHYGTQLACAEIVQLGISPNKAYFGVLFFSYLVSIYFCITRLMSSKSFTQKVLIVFFPLSIVFSCFNPLSKEVLTSIEGFAGGYPHLSILGSTSLLFFFFVLLEQKEKNTMSKILAATVPAIAFLLKGPHFFTFAIIYFIKQLKDLYESKNYKDFLKYSVLSVLLILSIIYNGINDHTQIQLSNLITDLKIKSIPYLQILAAVCLCFLFIISPKEDRIKAIPHVMTVLFLLFLYFGFSLYLFDQPDKNWKQILSLCPYVLWAALTSFSNSKNKIAINAITSFLICLAALVVINRISNCYSFLACHKKWHEFRDNKNIEYVLQKIPVEGSILVTNDLKYRASDHIRPFMQLQIPAIYGHQMYAGNSVWEKNYIDKKKYREQDILIYGSWEEIIYQAQKSGWTHAIIFKNSLFTKGSWNIVRENDEVFIAKF